MNLARLCSGISYKIQKFKRSFRQGFLSLSLWAMRYALYPGPWQKSDPRKAKQHDSRYPGVLHPKSWCAFSAALWSLPWVWPFGCTVIGIWPVSLEKAWFIIPLFDMSSISQISEWLTIGTQWEIKPHVTNMDVTGVCLWTYKIFPSHTCAVYRV